MSMLPVVAAPLTALRRMRKETAVIIGHRLPKISESWPKLNVAILCMMTLTCNNERSRLYTESKTNNSQISKLSPKSPNVKSLQNEP
jgi:hypothetical protein